VFWATVLGALGFLRLELALGCQIALTLVFWLEARRRPEGVFSPAQSMVRDVIAWCRQHPALTLIAVNAAGLELIRAILRPPLSWDSLEYHLLLSASWFQSHDLLPVFGPYRTNFQSLYPANGSLWLWWWLAPSHSEIYANWAFVPQWMLLALATGGIARELGALRSWPYASVVVALLPVILRFATTQYVDIFLGAAWLCALFYLIRWVRDPDSSSALLAGLGLGLALGSKVLGLPYSLALATSASILAGSQWRKRAPQVGLALCAISAVGVYFYLRNLWIGVGFLFPSTSPVGLARVVCDHTLANPVGMGPFANYTLLSVFGTEVPATQVIEAFLGTPYPWSEEMGLGPAFLPLVAAALAFPWLARTDRRSIWLCASQLVVLLVIWVVVPTTDVSNLYANIRYIIPALAIMVAFLFSLLEARGLQDRWIDAIAIAMSVQAILFTHTIASWGIRLIVSALTLVALIYLLSDRVRDLARRYAKVSTIGAATIVFVIGAPVLARFRERDRYRAFSEEYSVHMTPIRTFARAWSWIDRNSGKDPIAAVTDVRNWLYPPMGMRFQRRVHYVNYNEANHDSVTGYPNCNPRVDPDPLAWIANLRQHSIRWVLTSRDDAGRPFPLETRWAIERPELFRLRYSDSTSQIFEVIDPES